MGKTWKSKEDVPVRVFSVFICLNKKIHILLVQNQGGLQRGFGSGWDIIVPANWGMAFWMSFIYAGARAIGLREHYAMTAEQGIPSFPKDFPDTLAGKQYAYTLFKERSGREKSNG